ncbi:hypothetical protein IFM89_028353 [Coptis chinensis]|uniref:Ubiquitin-like domain-containing protein n=1 Tax=Coptis chinensis TaxID=261450 RepID=A0A835J121_9MAGN|nr:hypothetical protein IFM89_028353 [Coptis chinensis]
MEGEVVSLAALLMVVPEKVTDSIMVLRPDGGLASKDMTTIYECAIREVLCLGRKRLFDASFLQRRSRVTSPLILVAFGIPFSLKAWSQYLGRLKIVLSQDDGVAMGGEGKSKDIKIPNKNTCKDVAVGKPITLDVDMRDTGSLLSSVGSENKEGISVGQQELFYLGEELDDGRTIASYNIEGGSTIYAVFSFGRYNANIGYS